MVGNITSLTNNGLRDWLIQRVSAVILAIYSLYLMIFIVVHPEMDYTTWQNLFEATWWRIATIITLFSVLLHAWIGLWTVTTDYLKSAVLRLTIQMLILVSLLACFVWALIILWGN